MLGKRSLTRYLAFFGICLILLTFVNLNVSDVYPEYRKCSEIIDPLHSLAGPADGTDADGTIAPMDDESALRMLVLRCNNVQNDVFISYALISIGVALILGGLITSRAED